MCFHKPGLFCSMISFLIYINTFKADFVYDDRRAIVQNPDVTLLTSLSSLLLRDYWGTPLNYSGSHGSYRPLTVFTFRLNYYFFGLQPWSFHVTNVVLHCLCTYFFCVLLFSLLKMNSRKIYAAGILFAVHPIHCEAVAGVVGRADVLATLFCFLALLTYKKSCDCCNRESLQSSIKRQSSKSTNRGSVDSVQTLSHHKYPKPVKKKSRKSTFSKKRNNHLKEKNLQENLAVNFEDVLQYKRKLPGEEQLDSGSLSDHSHTTTDTLDSNASSSSSCSGNSTKIETGQFLTTKSNMKLNLDQSGASDAFDNNNNNKNSDDLKDGYKRLMPYKKLDFQMIDYENEGKSKYTKISWIIACFASSFCSILSKEIGYCALPLCIIYDLLFEQKIMDSFRLLTAFKQKPVFGRSSKRMLIAFSFWIGLLAFRVGLPVYSSGNRTTFPKFSSSDNPAAASDCFLTRVMTFNYLLACHIQMLFFPKSLSFDWSMDAIPLITSILDYRNLVSILMYIVAFGLAKFILNSIFSKSLDRSCEKKLKTNFDFLNDQTLKTGLKPRRLSSTSSEGSLTETRLLDKNRNIMLDNKSSTKGGVKHWKRKRGLSDFKSTQTFVETSETYYTLLFSVAVLVLALLPTTNLFFYVGFVLAERLLYLPSMASCILTVELAFTFTKKYASTSTFSTKSPSQCGRSERYSKNRHYLSHGLVLLLICYFGTRTLARNEDWNDETSLYKSGLATNSAKAFANLGNTFRSQNKISEAEAAYKQALERRSNMADVHYNLGLLYHETGRHKMAEERYRLAILYRPAMAVAYLNLGVVMAAQQQKEAAKLIYQRAAALENHETKDPVTHVNARISALFNLGCLLADDGDYDSAIVALRKAVNMPLDNYKPHSLYNMLGQCYLHLNQLREAEHWFNFSLVSKPDHVPAHLTLANLHSRRGLLNKAIEWYSRALKLEPENKEIYQRFGNFLTDDGQYQKAALLLSRAADSSFGADDYDLVFSAANAYRQAKLYHKAEEYFKKAVKLKPNRAAPHLNLGAIYHLQARHELAFNSYHRALQLQPNNKIILENLAKLKRSI